MGICRRGRKVGAINAAIWSHPRRDFNSDHVLPRFTTRLTAVSANSYRTPTSHIRLQAVPRRTHTTRPVRSFLLCQVVRGRRVTFAPSSAYDSVQVSHDDVVTPALILAKCGPSISTLDCLLSVPRAPARHPRLPSDGSSADPLPPFLLRPLHLPVCDPRALYFPSPFKF